jgi:hypothetical protein
MRNRLFVLAAGLLVLPAIARAQARDSAITNVIDELRRLRAELDRTRAEIQELRTELGQLKTRAAPEAPDGAPTLATQVEMLQSQVAEQARTKVESDSRFPVKIFGTIHSTMAFNSGNANWLENPNIVGAPQAPTGSFSATARQTRLGLRADGLALGKWLGSGAAVFDFFGGIPAFQTGQVMGLPRLLYAYARFDHGNYGVQVGQDEMILAPRNPTSVAAYSFPLLYRSGNLYLRLPQARVESRLAGTAGAELRGTVGIVAPVGGDFSAADYTFVPPALGGERSRRPGVQARIGWQQGDDARGVSIAVSSHYSRERHANESLPSWATAFDFDVRGGRIGLMGEGFVGRNLDAFGGALGQPTRSAGGFLEARVRATARWHVIFGAGTDEPGGAAMLSRNVSGYSSLTFHMTPEVATSLEYRWLETTAVSLRRQNHHVNWALTYGF